VLCWTRVAVTIPINRSETVADKAVFFDRDGVLDVDQGYLFRQDQLQWIPGAREAVAYLTKQGYKIFVVTNQSGIARGYYTIADMEKLHAFMQEEFQKTGGAITKFYYCPHHPTKGTIPEYSIACNCRKPKPGMILKAFEEYDLDKEGSFMIGDMPKDMEAARAAGIRGYQFAGGNLLEFVEKILAQ
jgi:D-glycero-D-manno-heptose 1,7-bisphosphate phosphatase